MMFQICYASRADHAFDDLQLTDLLKKARDKNQLVGITGLLLYENKSFIQILEGEERAVINTYNRIRNDPRHEDLLIMFKGNVEQRSFESWDMGFFHAGKKAAEDLPGYAKFFGKEFSMTEFRRGADRARLIFQQFRDGLWRRAVNF